MVDWKIARWLKFLEWCQWVAFWFWRLYMTYHFWFIRLTKGAWMGIYTFFAFMTSSIVILSHDIYINRLHFLSLVDWCITWIILAIDDIINVKKLKILFSTIMTSSMVITIHVIYQSTRLKKCSRLIYSMTHYDHRWRHKCRKTQNSFFHINDVIDGHNESCIISVDAT